MCKLKAQMAILTTGSKNNVFRNTYAVFVTDGRPYSRSFHFNPVFVFLIQNKHANEIHYEIGQINLASYLRDGVSEKFPGHWLFHSKK